MPEEQIQYSERYSDDVYEYRHVILPPDIASSMPIPHLMTETEWRNLGVKQSPGWRHFMIHSPEPHVLIFRRPLSESNPQNPLPLTESQANQPADSNAEQEDTNSDNIAHNH